MQATDSVRTAAPVSKRTRRVIPLVALASCATLLFGCSRGTEGGNADAPDGTGATADPAATVVESGAEGTKQESTPGELFVDEAQVERNEDGEYIVTVTGNFPDACSRIGAPSVVVEGTTAAVTVGSVKPADAMCAQVLTPFRSSFGLDTSAMAPGTTYTLTVNGAQTTFTFEG